MGAPQCTAHNRKGERCKRSAIPGRPTCYMHGGRTPSGELNPNFKHGKYSKVIPRDLADRYERARKDTELLALGDDIALLETRLNQVLSKVGSGEAAAVWRRLQEIRREITRLRRFKSEDVRIQIAALMDEQDELIEQGVGEMHQWFEIGELMERRRKLIESERKRLIEMQAVVRVEEAMLLLRVVAQGMREAVEKHISDPVAARAILVDVQRVLDQYTSRGSAEQPGPTPGG